MKKINLAIFCLWSVSALAANTNANRFGFEGNYGTSGASFGFVSYSNTFEAGIFGGTMFDNAAMSSSTSTFSFSIGPRFSVEEGTFISVGADMTAGFGTLGGATGYSPLWVGPYVAVERLLSADVLLSAWIYPYLYSRTSSDASTAITAHYFLTQGQVGVSYFF